MKGITATHVFVKIPHWKTNGYIQQNNTIVPFSSFGQNWSKTAPSSIDLSCAKQCRRMIGYSSCMSYLYLFYFDKVYFNSLAKYLLHIKCIYWAPVKVKCSHYFTLQHLPQNHLLLKELRGKNITDCSKNINK